MILYCINQPASVLRRERMIRRFSNRGLLDRVVFIEATPCDSAEAAKYVDIISVGSKESKVVACFISHLNALRMFLSTSEASCIVCEDDVLIHNQFGDRIKTVLSEAEDGAPLISLGYFASNKGVYHEYELKKSEDIRYLGKDNIWGTQMYWISREYAKKCLEMFDRKNFGLDDGEPLKTAEVILRRSGGLIVFPPLAIEDCMSSEIDGDFRASEHLRFSVDHNYTDYAMGEPREGPLANRVVLTTMVRNESKVIQRMIKSTLPVIDAVFVCDTGSTDNTLELAREASSGLPYAERSERWRDFSHNRTKTIEYAKEFIKTLGWSPEHVSILLLDADQTIEFDGEPSRKELTGYDVVQIRQSSGSEDWMNTRVIRADIPCKYIHRTHEYLSHQGKTSHNAAGVRVVEHSDGGCRLDKSWRDIELLKLDLQDNPDDARSMFYLARAYRDVGDIENAMKWYHNRSFRSDFEEERWTAQLHFARVELDQKNIKSGRRELWKAFSERPWRSEPLLNLATSFMDENTNEGRSMALQIALIGKSIPYPKNDVLFVEKDLYRFEFDKVVAICSYYLGEHDQGLRSAERLRLMNNCIRHHEAVNYLVWYTKKLESVWTRDVPFTATQFGHPCNPSIITYGDGYLMSVRSVNYMIDNTGTYHCDGAIKSKTHLVCLDSELRKNRQIELKSTSMNSTAKIQNVEDVRLAGCDDTSILCLGVRADGASGIPREYIISWNFTTGECERQEELVVSQPEYCEKNWLPFYDNGALKVLYSSDPVTVLNYKNNEISVECKNAPLCNLSGFRGSAAPIQWQSGWLYVVHEVATLVGERRTYIHRFCFMDLAFNLVRHSAPFYFEEKGIEFCAGMVRYKDGVIMTYGINDARARMTYVYESTINNMLSIASPSSQ